MIATDTRISYGRSMGRTSLFCDDNDKLLNLDDMGWMAGAGAYSFIEIMQDKLQDRRIISNEQVKDLFIESYCEIEKLNIYDKETLDTTGIAVSWISFNPEISWLPLFRIGIFSNKTILEETPVPMMEKNIIYLLYPFEYIVDKEKINEFNRKYSLNYVFDGDYNKFIYTIACIFNEIASNSKSVSKICDIGLMNIDSNGIQKISIKEDVDHLLGDYKNNYENTNFNVVWSTQNKK